MVQRAHKANDSKGLRLRILLLGLATLWIKSGSRDEVEEQSYGIPLNYSVESLWIARSVVIGCMSWARAQKVDRPAGAQTVIG